MRRIPVLIAVAVVFGGSFADRGAAVELRLSRYNRVYENVTGDLAPLDYPPVRIRLSSPGQTVLVKDNTTALEPLGGGRFGAKIEVELLGKGELVVDVDLGGSTHHLEDEVLLPRQRVVVDGILGLERVGGGYRVRVEKLPPALRVEIRSRLVNEILDLCGGAAILTLGALDCGPLSQALERPEVPLEGVTRELLLPDSDLTDDERATLDRLLTSP